MPKLEVRKKQVYLDNIAVLPGDALEVDQADVHGRDRWLMVRVDRLTSTGIAVLVPLAGGQVFRGEVPVGAELRWPAARLVPTSWGRRPVEQVVVVQPRRPTPPPWRDDTNRDTPPARMVRQQPGVDDALNGRR